MCMNFVSKEIFLGNHVAVRRKLFENTMKRFCLDERKSIFHTAFIHQPSLVQQKPYK